MGVDTILALIKELEVYQQLTTNHLNDREVNWTALQREVYERQKKDVLINHILFSLSPNATGADTMKSDGIGRCNKDFKNGVRWEDAVKFPNDIILHKSGTIGMVFIYVSRWIFTTLKMQLFIKNQETIFPIPIRTKFGIPRTFAWNQSDLRIGTDGSSSYFN